MTIEVKEREDGSFDISWDENDPQESMLNNFTEQDFIDVITQHLDELNEKDETDGTTETTAGDVD